MEGCDGDGRAVLSRMKKTTVTAAAVDVCSSIPSGEGGWAHEGNAFEAAAEASTAEGVGHPRLHYHFGGPGSAVRCNRVRCASSGDATLVDKAESCRDLGGFAGVTFYGEPLETEQIVAYTLYRWATGESYDNSTSSFGMGRASGVRAVCNVTTAMLRVYGDKISWPTGVRKHVVLRAFLDKGFPICHGAVDCTHIYVDKPANAPSENYFDCKHRFSVIVQVVVDLDQRVLDAFVGYPGNCHDIRVIQLSSLSGRVEEGMLFRGPPVTLPGGVRTNGYILGDNGYPPSEWVVVLYRGINQHPDEERFDTKQKVARLVVERAFGRLKGMWRLFLRTHKTNLDTLPQQFTVVCILHNILLDTGIEFDENLLWEVDENGVRRRLDLGIHHPPQPVTMLTSTHAAHTLHNALAERMKHM
ncbi:hypothetical protein CBR_g40722 [Chara braunii]|uniref:DDE Tnp4 domain-containing protein n=1 Tax=Chara braunii TaxID=69332 RepID=A0A388LUB6_CHABU|nr:hypothetical protein CBR_g40722 [Chara braunii]|eukprot:GBG85910.1 hypothetical protein CBR_g40722 [Chara braunii]